MQPRADLALLNGIAHILIRQGWIDGAYIDRHTTGFDALMRLLEDYTPERVSGIAGLSEEQPFKTAILIGRSHSASIGWTMGVNYSTKGTETVNAICRFSLLTGKSATPGPRRSPSPASVTPWEHAKPASPPACPATASSMTLAT